MRSISPYFTILLFWAAFVQMSFSDALVAQQSHEIWFDTPAERWEMALPLGNGKTGAMVFGGVSEARYALNDHHLWSGGPVPGNESSPKLLAQVREAVSEGNYAEAGRLWKGMHGPYSARYLPLGDLLLEFPSDDDNVSVYKRSLDLGKALSTVSYEKEGVVYKREAFVSHPDQVMVVRLSASEAGKLHVNARLSSQLMHTIRREAPMHLMLTGKAPAYVAHRDFEPEQVVYEPEGEGMVFETHLKMYTQGGELCSTDSTIGVSNADEVLWVLATSTSFNGYAKSPVFEGKDPNSLAEAIFDSIGEYTWDYLYNRHLADYTELYDRVSLDLGPTSPLSTDQRLGAYSHGSQDHNLAALYFQFGRYLLIASSRVGTPPANLQGIWNQHIQPPWGSNYTTNINTQMNFWPAELTNLSELHHSLFDFMEMLAVNGAKTAQVNYGIEAGWLAHHNSDIWAKTSPTGGQDWDPKGAARWSCWPMGGAWFTLHLWEHYLYTGDKDFLAHKAWPLMKGSAEFLLNWMLENEHGHLITNPSTSPENSFVQAGEKLDISMASTMDMSIIRESFSSLLRASEILGIDNDFTQSVRAAVPRLYPFHIGRLGQLQEWFLDWDRADDTHRHISHLFSLYPGSQLSPEYTPELVAACKQTLKHRGDVSTGWSMAWKLNWWARLKDGNRALAILKEGIKPHSEGGATYGNLFSSAHKVFQIDANFGGPAGIAELLLQSHAGYLHLLPALPDAWEAGTYRGLVARGGFVVDAVWSNGELQACTIYSKLGGKCRILLNAEMTSRSTTLNKAEGLSSNPLLQKPEIPPFISNVKGELIEPYSNAGILYEFHTEPGETYHFSKKP